MTTEALFTYNREEHFFNMGKGFFFIFFISISFFSFIYGGIVFAESGVTPTDPHFEEQYYLKTIGAPSAWSLSTGSSQVVVAVIDTGVDIDHPDLINNIWKNTGEIPGDGLDNDKNDFVDDIFGWDFVNNIPDPRPKFGGKFSSVGINHGTLISGIIAAEGNNGIGVTGISWRSKIMPLRAFNNRGESDVSTVVRAIDYAIAKKVDVINFSFVGQFESEMFHSAIKRAMNANILIVAASGNDEINKEGFDLTKNPTMYPTCFSLVYKHSIIGVASLEEKGQKAHSSNYGSCVTLSAPGVSFYTTQVVNYEQPNYTLFYGNGWSGTSLATALVSGSAALLKSLNQSYTPKDIISLLKETCVSVDDINYSYKGKLGCGQINLGDAALKAINSIQKIPDSKIQEEPIQEHKREERPALGLYSYDGKTSLTFVDTNGSLRNEIPSFTPFLKGTPYTFVASKRDSRIFVGATGKGVSPRIRVFNDQGVVLSEFIPYDKRFRGGVTSAIGDVDGDGEEEIITVPGPTGGPHVRVFTFDGVLKYEFFVGSAREQAGLRLALGDMNRDGTDDILITQFMTRNVPTIRIYDFEGNRMNEFKVKDKEKNVGSVHIATGDVDNDNELDIITMPTEQIGTVNVMSMLGMLKSSWYPFGKKYTRGGSLAIGDFFSQGSDRILVASVQGKKIQLKAFDGTGVHLKTIVLKDGMMTPSPRIVFMK